MQNGLCALGHQAKSLGPVPLFPGAGQLSQSLTLRQRCPSSVVPGRLHPRLQTAPRPLPRLLLLRPPCRKLFQLPTLGSKRVPPHSSKMHASASHTCLDSFNRPPRAGGTVSKRLFRIPAVGSLFFWATFAAILRSLLAVPGARNRRNISFCAFSRASKTSGNTSSFFSSVNRLWFASLLIVDGQRGCSHTRCRSPNCCRSGTARMCALVAGRPVRASACC